MALQISTGASHLTLVNSKFTRGVFAETFFRLHRKGVRPQVQPSYSSSTVWLGVRLAFKSQNNIMYYFPLARVARRVGEHLSCLHRKGVRPQVRSPLFPTAGSGDPSSAYHSTPRDTRFISVCVNPGSISNLQ